jgi:hypothetical protein
MSLSMIFSLGITAGMAQTEKTKCACGSMLGYYNRLKTDREFAKNEKQLEKDINVFVQRYKRSQEAETRSGIVVIPVVVHVVYNNSRENISDNQILSQIDALNRDFRRANRDVSTVPDEFMPFVADTRIEFVLAARDPNNLPTSGITRTKTDVKEFSHDFNAAEATERNPMKFTASGGKDAWPAESYLNIWVCDLSDFLLGYASFPSDLKVRPKEDGVVVDFENFGTIGTATEPYNMGRTTTHEIGHWLNLRHIWGDERPGEDACLRSDFVHDTPNQGSANHSCPTHPQKSCGSNDMFMNYMDYVFDKCMTMFTHGQSDRMNAVLYTTRSAIVSSQGDIPPPEIAKADLLIRDSEKDLGKEPNVQSNNLYNSHDIWVRHRKDGFINHEHQNPNSSAVNYVYVRVRNCGNAISKSATLKLYWAKASAGVSWPQPWHGSQTLAVPLGGIIGEMRIDPLPASEFQILEFKWNAPNPLNYAGWINKNIQFSLLARIEEGNAAPFAKNAREGANLYQNVKMNNNIALKNVSLSEEQGERMIASFLISNYEKRRKYYRLSFENQEDAMSIFEHGEVRVSLENDLYRDWRNEGKIGKGIKAKRKKDGIRILHNGAYLDNIKLKKNESSLVTVWFKPHNAALKYKRQMFKLDVKQYNIQRIPEKFVGENTLLFRVKK